MTIKKKVLAVIGISYLLKIISIHLELNNLVVVFYELVELCMYAIFDNEQFVFTFHFCFHFYVNKRSGSMIKYMHAYMY